MAGAGPCCVCVWRQSIAVMVLKQMHQNTDANTHCVVVLKWTAMQRVRKQKLARFPKPPQTAAAPSTGMGYQRGSSLAEP